MKNSRILWSLMAFPLLAACSNEDIPETPDTNLTPGRDGVYMSVQFNPSGKGGTRSSTSGDNASSDGVEVGSDVENAVKSVMLIIADRENKFIASSVVSTDQNGNQVNGTIESAIVNGDNVMYRTTATFDKTELATYYEENKGNGEVNVFVICNPTSALQLAIENLGGDDGPVGNTAWTNMVYSYSTSDGIWDATRGFTMSNISIAQRNLPPTLAEWNNYNTALKAFDLSGQNATGTSGAVDNLTNRGAVSVERMAARFDFRDGSQLKDAGGNPIGNGVIGQDFTYAVVKNPKEETIVNVKVYAMALTNMSTSQYYLPRVSPNGLSTNVTLCGPEKAWFNGTGGNYVVSTNSNAKAAIIKENFSQYFQYPFFSQDGLVSSMGQGWDWKYVTDVIQNGESDNYGDKSFHVWRYLTENTIPAPSSRQVNSQSTGVVFKTRMLPTAALNDESSDKYEHLLYEALTYANNGAGSSNLHQSQDLDPTLYSLSGNSLYVTWENVQEAALSEAGFDATKGQNQDLDRNAPLYRIVYGTGGVGTVTDAEGKEVFKDTEAEDTMSANYLWQRWETARKTAGQPGLLAARTAFKAKATSLGFTLYQSSQDPVTGEWGYYCYYYYWNRHNDNGQDGVMGPMEFSVVRNNVYKLTITNIATLGHPRIPENDPDDPKPDTPDEESEVYMTVTVDVLPWVVRINNIHF